ncbi:coiled-coil and C2 domain-containing protein 1-like isoform X2 [Acanthaster planci]|uniref:Coiled-coil and C2 domain-containing protein 1-like isoform X2 n=1 Tax=Acanthaster planci TaxID=133434 RepID=A0A8B7ZUG0_ACAPL|nr:coiled-coil and C2 domain-containing protein 1-like isoform X2 [Acanthaster planci]
MFAAGSMFGGGRKKKGGADDAKQHQSQNSDLFDLSQLRSLAGMPQSGVDEDDFALEAELVALMADDGSVGPSRSTARTRVRPSQIDNLDIEVKEGKEDEVTEEDLDNPDYLAELAMLSEEDANMETLRPSPRPSPRASPKPSPQPSPRSSPAPQRKTESDVKVLVQERLEMYQLALKNAEAANEGSKARRYGRGIKTLKGLEKKLKQGAKIDESEIPPMVATGGQHKPVQEPEKAPPPPASEAVQPSRSNNVSVPGDPSTKGVGECEMALLKKRQHEYKMAALEAKRAGDRETAAEHLRVAKQFDSVISAIEQGEEVDLSGMPPPPSSALQGTSALVPPPKQQKIQAPVIDVVAPGGQSEATASDAEPSMPSTPLEALQQRHDTYKALLDKATTEGNASKCRRLGRIVKNYQEAIKKERAGKPVDYEELATLPGFSPIPPRGSISKSQGQPSPGQPSPGQPSPGQPSPGQPSPGQPSPGQPSGASSQPATAAASARPALTRPPSVKEAQNLKNLRILTQRQKQYKTLALQAKKEGDMGEAMRLLKLAKGFDSMITASENGLPVNMESIPPSPTQQQFSVEDERERMICDPPAGEELSAEVLADSKQLYARLMATLNKQIQICATNEKQYMQLGNLSTSKRFGEMKHSCQQDLDVLTVSMSHSDPVPRFHYETRTIPSIRVCPDLTDTEVEVSVIKGIQLKLPSGEKDLDTYIKFEFPYPNDEPQTGKTGWSKGFEMVEYNDSTKLNIQRNRSFASCVKRRSIRFEVYYGRGFLRSDKLLAQASLKLADLESKCEIHESVPLYDGRKPTGGKLEVKVRVHHPVSGVKEDQIKEKWLVINSTHKKSSYVPTSSSSLSSPSKQPTPHGNTAANPSQKNVQPADSLAVLNWELETLKKKLAEFQAQRRSIPKELNEQQKILSDRMHKLQLFLKEGGKQARQAYVARLQASLSSYFALAKQSLQAGNKEKAGVLMAKRKLVESEIASLTK